MTKAEKEVFVETWSLHMGATPPEERIYLSVNHELHTPRQCTFNASISAPSLPDFETQEIQGLTCPPAINAERYRVFLLKIH